MGLRKSARLKKAHDNFTIKRSSQRILILSDLHIPFHDPRAFTFLEELKKEYKPTRIIGIGDTTDLYGMSKYLKDPLANSANHEMNDALGYLSILYDMFPKVDVCFSNHAARVTKKAWEAGIPPHFMKTIKEWMHAPKGWNWRERWLVETAKGLTTFIHGESFTRSNWKTAPQHYWTNVVLGHIHVDGGFFWLENMGRVKHFVMNVGAMANPNDPIATNYSRLMKSKMIPGTSVMIDGNPRYHTMDEILGELPAKTRKIRDR